MRVYYDQDADINLINGRKVAIIGYGSQGRAHALNLKDSGVSEVVVGLRPGSTTAKKVEADGLKVMSVAEAAGWADLMMMATPDELQADIYKDHIADNIRDGAAIAFAHGLNVHFGLIEAKATVDVMMIAPKEFNWEELASVPPRDRGQTARNRVLGAQVEVDDETIERLLKEADAQLATKEYMPKQPSANHRQPQIHFQETLDGLVDLSVHEAAPAKANTPAVTNNPAAAPAPAPAPLPPAPSHPRAGVSLAEAYRCDAPTGGGTAPWAWLLLGWLVLRCTKPLRRTT